MQGFFKEHLRPLAGSAGLHLALVGALALAALRWTSQQPPVELAIQGYVVDGPVKVKPLPVPREAPAEHAPPPVEAVKPSEPVVEPPPDRRAEDAAAAERAAEQLREQQLVQERAARERELQVAREKAAAEQRRAEEAERKRTEEAAAKRKAADEAERKKAEAVEAKRKADEKAQAEREAKVRAEREADLQRQLTAEEEEGAAAAARAGVMDEYRLMLVQAIERATGREAHCLFNEEEGGGVSRLVADVALAREKLGFQPKGDLETGLRRILREDEQFKR